MTVILMAIISAVAVAALVRVVQMEQDKRRDAHIAHAKCVAHIASVVSARVIAITLHDLAEKWDSIEEQSNLRVLANERYQPGGPSMPVIWLHEQARLIEEGK